MRVSASSARPDIIARAESFWEPLRRAPAKPVAPPKQLYRVRMAWADIKSQIGAYESLENARRAALAANPYKVFDESGKQV